MLTQLVGNDNPTNRLGHDAYLLKWMAGVAIAIQLGIFWLQWQAVDRLSSIEARLSAIESGLPSSSGTLETP
jgi:hypothetical protein